MNDRTIWVAHGPTIDKRAVESICPDAHSLPPLAGGDLTDLGGARGDILVIVDGFFYARPAVRHEEISAVLDRGVVVVGASSMGALRAAEMDNLGMIGEGAIYRAYSSGYLNGDDEVAVVHDATEPATTRTVALVTLRWACLRLARDSVISVEHARTIIASAKELPFYDRTWGRIGGTVPRSTMTALSGYVQSRPDIKFRDAAHALRMVRTGVASEVANARRSATAGTAVGRRSNYYSQWRAHQPRQYCTEGRQRFDASDGEILATAQLLLTDYDIIHRDVILETLLQSRTTAYSTATSENSERIWAAQSATFQAVFEGSSEALDEVIALWSEKVCPDWRLNAIRLLKRLDRWAECVELYAISHEVSPSQPRRVLSPAAAYMILLAYWGRGPKSPIQGMRVRGFDDEWRFGDVARDVVEYARTHRVGRSRDAGSGSGRHL